MTKVSYFSIAYRIVILFAPIHTLTSPLDLSSILSLVAVDTTIRELYNINPSLSATIGAIIYMFIEPEYRKFGVGSLALEVISAIHSVQAVDFTVLVADDNGSGGLVRWYESHGFSKAPLMQKVLGSPDGKFGTAMIRPVSVSAGFFNECQVKWW